MSKFFIAIDPGREKTGVALLSGEGFSNWHSIVASDDLIIAIQDLLKRYTIDFLVMGSGTSSKQKQNLLQQAFPQLNLYIVNEYKTTEEARRLYFKKNPPRGLKRLIPIGMQVPPCPIDDYAAIIIGRKYLAQQKNDKA